MNAGSSMQHNRLAFLLVIALTFCRQADSQWSRDPFVNTPISVEEWAQQDASIVADGSGGSIIAWTDTRTDPYVGNIYAQRINASGEIQWTLNGVGVLKHPYHKYGPKVVSDGAGGAIVVWHDKRNGSTADLYAQRINSAGTIQWDPSGIPIVTAPYDQLDPELISDGAGGAIITWFDRRTGTSYDVYAQRVSSAGALIWTINGIPISTGTGDQLYPKIVSDDAGGAVIAWQDSRSSYSDIYAQRVNAAGSVYWTANGLVVCNAAFSQLYPTIASDGSSGAIITWTDERSGRDIYAQRIFRTGFAAWAANGVEIAVLSNDQTSPEIISDGVKGAIITWSDYRYGATSDIFAQRVNMYGAAQWTANGVAVVTAANNQNSTRIISDGTGGAVIAWSDYRNGANADLYVQKVNANGAVQWTNNGTPLSMNWNTIYSPEMIGDGNGGAILSWYEPRWGSFDLFAQNVDRNGYLGSIAPKIDAVRDIANDQGGALRLLWQHSLLDTLPSATVRSYAVRRGVKKTGILGRTAAGSEVTADIYWENVATVPADWSNGYTVVIPTKADSGLQGAPWYYFQVVARTLDSTVFWTSNIDSGYSVDNIPPAGTGGGVITWNSSGSVMLKWNRNRTDSDLMGYVVFRGTVPGFTMSDRTRLSLTTDTVFVDGSAPSGSAHYYRVASIDKHGNIGVPTAELSPLPLAAELTSFTAAVSGRSVVLQWKTATESGNHGYCVERKYPDAPSSSWIELGVIRGAGTSSAPNAYSFTDASPVSGRAEYRLRQTDINGAVHFSQTVEVNIAVPAEFKLYQNYPNPFNPSTSFEFTVPVDGLTTLKIFTAVGQEITTLFDGIAEAGTYHRVSFNAKDLSSGVYFAQLRANGRSQLKKMLLVR